MHCAGVVGPACLCGLEELSVDELVPTECPIGSLEPVISSSLMEIKINNVLHLLKIKS